MNLEGIKLSQLRSLVAVAKYGNFSEAALQMEVSQSAVSHAIASLEEELGVVLLSRGRHGATVTPVGERVVSHARQVLSLVDVIGKEANLAKGLQGGQVRLTSIRSVATHVLPEAIVQFRTCFPDITVTLLEQRGGDDGIERSLREGRADIGIICVPPAEEFETWELMADEYLALLPPNAKVPGDRLTWEHLATYPIILPPGSDYCSLLIRGHLARLGRSISAAYEIMEDSTIVGMVAKGVGATIMARLAAEPLLPEIQVHKLPVPLKRIIRVATHKDAMLSPAVYAFLDTLREMSQSGQLPAGKPEESKEHQVIPIAFPRRRGKLQQLQ